MATRKNYTCSVCQKYCGGANELEAHSRVHTGEKPFKCQYCGNDFRYKSSLTAHIKTVHYGEKPHKCDLCGKAFSQNYLLTEHIKVHSGGKVHKCDFCGMNFAIKDDLAVHVNTEHDGKYMCSKCGIKFISKTVMEIHSQSCQGPPRDFADQQNFAT